MHFMMTMSMQQEVSYVASIPNSEYFFDYNRTILDSIEQIKHAAGQISVKEIYSSLNVSKSKLEATFQQRNRG